MDWGALRRREVTPPFVPSRGKGRPEDDVKNIDKEFLKMAAHDTPMGASALNDRRGAGSRGNSRGDSRAGERSDSESSATYGGMATDTHFQDFSFIDHSVLD